MRKSTVAAVFLAAVLGTTGTASAAEPPSPDDPEEGDEEDGADERITEAMLAEEDTGPSLTSLDPEERRAAAIRLAWALLSPAWAPDIDTAFEIYDTVLQGAPSRFLDLEGELRRAGFPGFGGEGGTTPPNPFGE